jgi:hypothetical protein
MADELKILGVVMTTAAAAFQALKPVTERINRIKSLREQEGRLGRAFVFYYEWFQYLYRVVLLLISVASLAAILGFIGKLAQVGPLTPLANFFDNYAIFIVVVWGLVGIVGYTNLLSYVLLTVSAIFKRLRLSPSWINAWWFSVPTHNPIPIVIRPSGVSNVSDWILERLAEGQGDNPNRAKKPAGLTDDERANAALFGCLLEQQHYIRGWTKRAWGAFYDCLSSIRFGDSSAFSPHIIRDFDETSSFFEAVRNELNPCLIAAGQEEIPQSAGAAEDMQEALRLLKEEYKGSAANLARSRMPCTQANMLRAFRRARKFPCFDNDSMRPQCLKLMLVWDVWPEIEPGTFIYPFASNLAAFLVDRRVLITFNDVNMLPFKEGPTHAIFREAMRQIVEKVGHHMSTSTINAYQQYRQKLQNGTTHPLEWEIAYETDFFLWSYSYDAVRHDQLLNWRVNDQKFIIRKN